MLHVTHRSDPGGDTFPLLIEAVFAAHYENRGSVPAYSLI